MAGAEIETAVVRRHIELIHRLAEPLKEKGKLILFSAGEDPLGHHWDKKSGTYLPGKPVPVLVEQFLIGDVERNVTIALQWAAEHHRNVYMPLAVMRRNLGRHQKGGEADIVARGVLGIVLDFDDDAANRWKARTLEEQPDYVLQTSAARFQCGYLFVEPVDVAVAKGLAARLKQFAGADYCSIDMAHPWRVPGLLNWPNTKKHQAGRPLEPQLVAIVKEAETRTSAEVLDRAIPLAGTAMPFGATEFDMRLYRARFDVENGVSEAVEAWHKNEAGDPADWEAYVASRPQQPEDADYLLRDKHRRDAAPSHERIDTVFRMLPQSVRDKIATAAPTDDRSRIFAGIVGYFRSKHPEVPIAVIEGIFERFPDGPAAKYRGRLREEIERLYAKKSRREAYDERARERRGPKPELELIVGMLSENLDEAEALLMKHNNNIFRRGDFVVMVAPEEITLSGGEVVVRPSILPLTPLRLRELYTQVIDFKVWSNDRAGLVSVDAPHDFVRTYLDRKRAWKLPYLAAVVTTPFMRADGSLVQEPGYDAESCVLYEPNGVEFPTVPENPSRDDAQAALDKLDLVFGGFPFVPDLVAGDDGEHTETDERGVVKSAARSVAYSQVLSGMIRHNLPSCPLHAYSAPRARTGKTKVVDCASIIVSGHPAPPIGPGKDEAELEKRLTGELISGAQTILLDNLIEPLMGVMICQCLTQRSVKTRLLGTNQNPIVPCTAMVSATGNNLVIASDLSYRTLRSDLDSGLERPELRKFNRDAVDIARDLRPELAVAALTILRAWWCNQADPETAEPNTLDPIGGFEEWSRRVRDALVWLGQPDPWKTVDKILASG